MCNSRKLNCLFFSFAATKFWGVGELQPWCVKGKLMFSLEKKQFLLGLLKYLNIVISLPMQNHISSIYMFILSFHLISAAAEEGSLLFPGEAVPVFPAVPGSPGPVPPCPALPAAPSHTPVPAHADQQPLWSISSLCERWLRGKHSEEGHCSNLRTGKNHLLLVLLFTVYFCVVCRVQNFTDT